MQGYESGGHGASSATTLCFVPEVVDALRKEGYETPVLATGGIADGRQVLFSLPVTRMGVRPFLTFHFAANLGDRALVTQHRRFLLLCRFM